MWVRGTHDHEERTCEIRAMEESKVSAMKEKMCVIIELSLIIIRLTDPSYCL